MTDQGIIFNKLFQIWLKNYFEIDRSFLIVIFVLTNNLLRLIVKNSYDGTFG